MKCVEDWDRFDDLLNFLTGEIVGAIKRNLEQAGIAPDVAKALTTNIAFEIGAIVDGSRVMKHHGQRVYPILTFLTSGDELLHPGGSSWMHEYAIGWVEEAFNSPNK